MRFEHFVVFPLAVSIVCGQAVTHINIPNPLSVDEFTKHVEGKNLLKLLSIQTRGSPDAFPAYMKISSDHKLNPNYTIELWIDGKDGCQKIGFPMPGERSRLILHGDVPSNHVSLYSSSPDLYVWMVRCANWKPGSTVCPPDEVYIDLFRNGISPIDIFNDFKLLRIPLFSHQFVTSILNAPSRCRVSPGGFIL